MSDLEQSDIENMSDDESSVDENKQTSKPTFPQVNTKTDNINSKVDTKKATKTDDVDEVGEYSEEEDADEDADDDVVEESEVETDNDENESAGNSDNDDISVDEKSSITSKKKTSNVKKSSRQIEALPVVKLNIPDVFEKNDSDYESDADEDQEDDYLQKI